MKQRVRAALGSLTAVLLLLLVWTARTEPHAHSRPRTAAAALGAVLEKPVWTAAEYRLLGEQTGLFAPALDLLRAENRLHEVYAVQQAYLSPAAVVCTGGGITRAERLTAPQARLTALEPGDILISPCTHVLGWRSGHAALVIDAQTTLEAVVIGEASSLQSIKRWERFAAFAVYRLRDTDAQTRAAIAAAASTRLTGVPYRITAGITQPKRMSETVSGTQCAHLVWEAFAAFGYDLDANGGKLIVPADLARSPFLELKQVYGLSVSYPA